MITKLIQRPESIKTRILMIIIGVTVLALLFSNLIEFMAVFIRDYIHDDINWTYLYWKVIFDITTIGLGIIIAYFFALPFLQKITAPIMHLSNIARQLSDNDDYALRAVKYADDEIGFLSDTFNILIESMEDKSNDLKSAREDADKANAQKSSFLAMMSHEIRTPINGIIGTTDLLIETRLTGRQKDYVDVIERSAETLLELINDILDFSKIEAEKLTIETITFDLTQHIQDVIDMLQINVGQKGLRLFFTNNLKAHYFVQGDPTRIKQILINLVSNAIKFTEKGSVTIHLDEDSSTSEAIRQIWISVTDTGIGIPEDRQTNIFNDFSQADDTMTRKYGGTGLGLAICKKLVEMMNGTIGVKSQENIGSTFWFSLPMPVATDIPKITAVRQSKPMPHSDNQRILFVEDNETNIMITSEMLRKAGYEVITCRNGQEAYNIYQSNPIPLILMDCRMPVMDGWASTQKIRGYEKDNNLPPAIIVALTANAMAGDREKCIAAGMDDYLSKPFKKDDLYQKLDDVICAHKFHGDDKAKLS